MPWQYWAWIGLWILEACWFAYLAGRGIAYKATAFQWVRSLVFEAVWVGLMIWGAGGLSGWKHITLLCEAGLSIVLSTYNFGNRGQMKFTGKAIGFALIFGGIETWLLVTG